MCGNFQVHSPFHAIFYNLVQGCQLILLPSFHHIIFYVNVIISPKKKELQDGPKNEL